ncbi:Txe/YoeB family addiction module toxin [Noviherbaspirillum sp. 1P10PC]|uniref:Txe/YoeB family addiction module toxin n=1 Tax=Noviherbaspirillum sp. 1P10PC TaxID=3132292 RepID=UPI0039A3F744
MATRTLKFTDEAWDNYLFWRLQDRKTLRRINDLIREVLRSPEEGIGKPERLRGNLAGLWSRRIDDTNRLVYKILDQEIVIVSCRYHY